MNTVVIVATEDPASKFNVNSYFKNGLRTWEYWCKKNNVDLVVIDKLDKHTPKGKWMKPLVFDYVKEGKVALVDADTMVKWDAPNFFDLYNDDEFCGVLDTDSIFWLHNSITAYQKFFPEVKLDTSYYINSGVMLFSDKHKGFFNTLREFYLTNKEELDNWSVPNTGSDQTIINFLLQKEKVKQKMLPDPFNQFGLLRKDLLGHNWQTGDKTPFFIKTGYIWHFTGFAMETRVSLMQQFIDQLGHYYA